MGNAWVSHQYFIAQDNARMGRNREIGTRTFPIVCACFFPIQFPSYGILHYMGNAWCFVSISHSIGRSSKIHPVVKIVIKIPIFFPKHGYFSSIIFPPYGILQHVKNAWVFPSISHNMGKCSKIRPMV